MKLYLVRHAIATPRDPLGTWPDSERPLTEEGSAKMRQHVKALVRLGERIDLVLTSPLVRARQTAELLVEGLDPRPEMNVDIRLAPAGDFAEMLSELSGRYPDLGIALVGHEPDMSEMAAVLVTGSDDADFEFKKGAICRIDIDEVETPPNGRLRWLLAPKQLRAIGKRANGG